jgi:ribosome-associated toxin RatA of RatAB toxin-antitoxin module
MTIISRSALMPYAAQTMYEVVNNVAEYPDFLPWCADARILSQSDTLMEASILMKKAGVNHWFSTRNSLMKNKKIEIELLDGPFKRLEGSWEFTDYDDQGSRIKLDLEFEFPNGLGMVLIAPVFSRIANTMVDSFCTRAHEINKCES